MHRSIFRIAFPSIISNITVPLLGLVDTAITGHLGAAACLGAIAVGTSLFSSLYWLFNFLRMGTGGLTAQAYGAGKSDEIAALYWRPLLLATAIAALLMAAQVPLANVGFALLDPSPEVLQLARSYYDLLIWGAFPTLALFAINGWLLGMQDATTPMLVAVMQNVVNIALSLYLVVAEGWGLVGVATGTLVAQWVGFSMAFVLSWRRLLHDGHQLRRGALTDLAAWRRLFVVNREIFLRTLCLVSVMFSFTAFGAKQGETLLAVNTLLLQFFLFTSYVMDGLAYAGEALGGRFWGERNPRALRLLVRSLFLWGLGAAVVFALAFGWGGQLVLALLTNIESVRQAAMPYLPYVVALPVVSVAAFLLDGLFIGFTATRAMLIGVALAAAFFAAVQFVLASTLGNHALWLAFLGYLGLRGAIGGVLLPRQLKKLALPA